MSNQTNVTSILDVSNPTLDSDQITEQSDNQNTDDSKSTGTNNSHNQWESFRFKIRNFFARRKFNRGVSTEDCANNGELFRSYIKNIKDTVGFKIIEFNTLNYSNGTAIKVNIDNDVILKIASARDHYGTHIQQELNVKKVPFVPIYHKYRTIRVYNENGTASVGDSSPQTELMLNIKMNGTKCVGRAIPFMHNRFYVGHYISNSSESHPTVGEFIYDSHSGLITHLSSIAWSLGKQNLKFIFTGDGVIVPITDSVNEFHIKDVFFGGINPSIDVWNMIVNENNENNENCEVSLSVIKSTSPTPIGNDAIGENFVEISASDTI